MKIFGIEIFGKSNNEPIRTIEPLQSDIIPTQNIMPPQFKVELRHIRSYAYSSDIYRTIVNRLREEIFRNGLVIEKEYEYKCVVCDSTYEFKPKKCEVCGSGRFKVPPPSIRERLEQFIKKVNETQSLIDVLEMAEDDLNIYDNCYIVIQKEYTFNHKKEISTAEVKGIYRADPVFMRKLIDGAGRYGYDNNKPIYTCPEHRTDKYYNNGYCSKCGKKLYRAYFMQIAYGTIYNNPIIQYYIEGEVIHKTKYTKTLSYGIPPLLTLLAKVDTLLQQDNYLRLLYANQKPPKGILLVKTNNIEDLETAWKRLITEATANPHMIFPLAVKTTDKSDTGIQYLDFMRSASEMQFIEQRDEYRRIICSFFGVAPIFIGDISQSGGLNNEGLQITITNRAISHAQKIHNEILQDITTQLGAYGYLIRLEPNEQRDILNELAIERAKLENALLYNQLGFSVEMAEDGSFRYEKTHQAQPIQQTPTSIETSRYEGEPTIKSIKTEIDERIEKLIKKIMKEKDITKLKEHATELSISMKEDIGKEIIKIYETEARRLGKNIKLDHTDMNIIEAIKSNPELQKALDTHITETTTEIERIVSLGLLENKSATEIEEELKELLKTTKTTAERIARIETQKIQTLARENAYKKLDLEGKNKYKWLSIPDNRRTEICKRITERTKDGVSLDELKKIIKEEADKNWYNPLFPYTPHAGCRSIFVKKL